MSLSPHIFAWLIPGNSEDAMRNVEKVRASLPPEGRVA